MRVHRRINRDAFSHITVFFLDSSGCAALEQVEQRLKEFVSSASGVELIEDREGGSSWERLRVGEFQILQRGSVHERDPEDTKAEDRAIEFSGRLHLAECKNSGMFEVTVAFSEGNRAEFWKMAEGLKAAVVRTGRRWRRKVGDQTNE